MKDAGGEDKWERKVMLHIIGWSSTYPLLPTACSQAGSARGKRLEQAQAAAEARSHSREPAPYGSRFRRPDFGVCAVALLRAQKRRERHEFRPRGHRV